MATLSLTRDTGRGLGYTSPAMLTSESLFLVPLQRMPGQQTATAALRHIGGQRLGAGLSLANGSNVRFMIFSASCSKREFGLFSSIRCGLHERLQYRPGSFNHTGTEKGEPWSHGSPLGSDRLISRVNHATSDSPAPASCGCSPLSMNGMIEKVCPPRCSSFCTALTRRSPSGVLISSDR